MTTSTRVAMRRTDVSAAIVLLLIAEATFFFTFLFVVGPIATLARLLPLAAVLVLCAALYWGQNWARWALLAPVGFRVWRLSLLTATAWGLGRPGIALFLTLIILVELAAAFILLDRYLRYSPFPPPSHKNATTMSS
ncbi:MAG: hypothetical protein DMD64_14550 [Gemmatimonadetes bacterium]|nr:MAG: hypothetical protein DMD64_14550 [Gemmatimonadota bacterium]